LIHGLMMSSDVWVVSGRERSLGFALADAGYGNCPGVWGRISNRVVGEIPESYSIIHALTHWNLLARCGVRLPDTMCTWATIVGTATAPSMSHIVAVTMNTGTSVSMSSLALISPPWFRCVHATWGRGHQCHATPPVPASAVAVIPSLQYDDDLSDVLGVRRFLLLVGLIAATESVGCVWAVALRGDRLQSRHSPNVCSLVPRPRTEQQSVCLRRTVPCSHCQG